MVVAQLHADWADHQLADGLPVLITFALLWLRYSCVTVWHLYWLHPESVDE